MPGQVKLSPVETARLADFLGMEEAEFVERYTRLRPDRAGLSLKDKANGECIFLEGENCAVQPVKPHQCRAFPNAWRFPGFEKVCQARPVEVDEAEYQRRLAASLVFMTNDH